MMSSPSPPNTWSASVAAVEVVVAAVAPEGVDALVADEGVVAFGAAQHHVLAAGELQHAAVDVVPSPSSVGVRIRTLHAHDLGSMACRNGSSCRIEQAAIVGLPVARATPL